MRNLMRPVPFSFFSRRWGWNNQGKVSLACPASFCSLCPMQSKLAPVVHVGERQYGESCPSHVQEPPPHSFEPSGCGLGLKPVVALADDKGRRGACRGCKEEGRSYGQQGLKPPTSLRPGRSQCIRVLFSSLARHEHASTQSTVQIPTHPNSNYSHHPNFLSLYLLFSL